MRFPSIKAVAAELASLKSEIGSVCMDPCCHLCGSMDVRLTVHLDGSWTVRQCDSCHTDDGQMARSETLLDRASNCEARARELIYEARANVAD